MELDLIKLQTTWNNAAGSINSNNAKIKIEIEKLKNAAYKNKGYFATVESLINAYPTADAGSIAYVGSSYPYFVYTWNGNAWVNNGETGGDENVNLGNYYTKEETHEAIRDEYEVLSQKAYDSLVTKEERLYFCYEE